MVKNSPARMSSDTPFNPNLALEEIVPPDISDPPRIVERLADVLRTAPGGLQPLLRDGPIGHQQFAMLAGDLWSLCTRPASGADYASRGAQAIRETGDGGKSHSI